MADCTLLFHRVVYLSSILTACVNDCDLCDLAEYADIRSISTSQERLVVRNGVADNLSNDQSTGLGVRVLIFASSHDATAAELYRVTDLALGIPKASGLQSLP